MISVGMIALMRLKEEQMNENKKSVEYPYMDTVKSARIIIFWTEMNQGVMLLLFWGVLLCALKLQAV